MVFGAKARRRVARTKGGVAKFKRRLHVCCVVPDRQHHPRRRRQRQRHPARVSPSRRRPTRVLIKGKSRLMRTAVQTLVVAVEQPMFHPEAADDASGTSKRKLNEENNLERIPAKKARHNVSHVFQSSVLF